MGKRNHIPDVAVVQSFGPQPLPAFGFWALVFGTSSAKAFLCWWCECFQRADKRCRKRRPPQRDCSISWSWASSHKGAGDRYVDVKWFPVTPCSCVLLSPVGGKKTKQNLKSVSDGLDESGKVFFSLLGRGRNYVPSDFNFLDLDHRCQNTKIHSGSIL